MAALGITCYEATRSCFAAPKLYKEGVRPDQCWDFDSIKSFPKAIVARYPDKKEVHLWSEDPLACVKMCGLPMTDDNVKALKLFCNSAAGSGQPVLDSFLQSTNLGKAPEFVLNYRQCLRAAAMQDLARRPGWAVQLEARGYSPDQLKNKIHYLENSIEERMRCEKARADASMVEWISLESDGQVCLPSSITKQEILEAMGAGFAYKPYRSFDAIVVAFQEKHPEVNVKYFGIVDKDWTTTQFACAQGAKRLRQGENPALTFSPWLPTFIMDPGRMLKDMWRTVPGGEKTCTWWRFTEGGLWENVPDFVAQTQLCCQIQRAVAHAMRIEVDDIPKSVAAGTFCNSCLGYLDSHMYDDKFLKSLDGPNTRFFVQFSDGVVLDRRTLQISKSELEMYISKNTGYPFPAKDIQAVQDRLSSQGLHLESIIKRALDSEEVEPFDKLPDDVAADFDKVAAIEGC